MYSFLQLSVLELWIQEEEASLIFDYSVRAELVFWETTPCKNHKFIVLFETEESEEVVLFLVCY